MFLHNLKYEFLTCIRAKSLILWLILFPVILGTFFKVAFDGLYENTMVFSAVPVAVVEKTQNPIFRKVMDQISQGDDALFDAEYTDNETALEMLEKREITGIIYADDELSMTIATDAGGATNEGIRQTIMKSFIEQYNSQQSIIVDTVISHPDKLLDVFSAISETGDCNENIPLTNGNHDNTLSYFYNLVAMVAMLGSNLGLNIAISSQGNLSPVGARKCCSPTNKLISIMSSIASSFAVQAVCIIISVSYLAFVLKVDFGSKLPLVYLAGITGGMMGVSSGFVIGSFGNIGQNTKNAIATAFSLICCFFSGLMIGNMKAVVENYAPWFNRINPAAVISDALYCLNFYEDYTRYTEKIVTMLVMSIIFTIIGFILTRRRKYASL